MSENIQVAEEEKQSLFPLHLLFLAMAIMFIIVGSLLQHWNFKLGILATEYGMLVLPAVVYMTMKKNDIRAQFRFNLPKWSDVWKTVLAGLFFIPLVAFLNGIVNIWLLYGLNIQAPQIPRETGALAPLITFFIAAVTPGFCEEFFFRGLLLTEYEKKMGYFQAALISALLFGMFHYNIMNLFGPFALGLVFAWLMQVTNSIWTAMIGHMINNTFAVVMLYLTANVDQTANMEYIEKIGNIWPLVVVATLVMLAAIALPCAYVSTLFLRSIRKRHLKAGDQISIKSRDFIVVSAVDEQLTLKEVSRDSAEFEMIETNYEKLYSNSRVRLTNKHWLDKNLLYKIRLKEWWPVLICAIMYIGVNFLNITGMIAEAAR